VITVGLSIPFRARRGAAESADGGMFAALQRYPLYRRLWTAAMLGSLGQWMQSVALGWVALSLTDSPTFVGLVAFMAGVPFIVVSLPAGMLIDRFDRRTVLVVCQAFAAILAVAIAVDILAGWVQPWHLLVVAFLNGSTQAVLGPTQSALTPAVVDRKDLVNAIGLTSAGNNMTRIFGPSVAGAVIGFGSEGAAFLIQAAAVALACVIVLRTPFPRVERTGGLSPRRAVEGLTIIWGRDDLRGLFLLAVIPSFFAFPYIQFANVYARDILKVGPSGLGIMMALSGVGAMIGSLIVAKRRATEAQGRMLIILTAIYGLIVIVVALSRSIYLTVPLMSLGSGIGAFVMSQDNALLQHRITDDIRGRVLGAYTLTWGLFPLGALPMGLLAGRIGTPAAITIGAALNTIFALLLGARSRGMREV
jgi:MFS family permease